MKNLPPLKALRTFEVVARNNSFAIAAEELLVSPSAVSQQIKILETHLGTLLLNRNPKSVELTDDGKQLYPAVAQAFSLLNNASLAVSGRHTSISITTSASFAMAWLITRFTQFEEAHPNLSVYLNAAPKGSSSNALSSYDIEVAYSTNREEISDEYRLFDEFLLPVCSPIYAEKHNMVIQELSRHRLLLNSPEANDWQPWLKHHGIISSDIKPMLRKSVSLPTDASAIEMAIGGYGVALANLHYVLEKLENGILVPAFNVDAFLLGVHYLRYDPSYTRNAAYTLIKWLVQEAGKSESAINKWKNRSSI